MKRARGAVLLAAVVLSLSGCGSQEKTDKVSSITFGKGGEVTHQIEGNFEQDYYDLEGVESLANERVEEYAEEHGKDAVYLESVEEKGGNVTIIFQYATADDYSAFNYRELFMGTVEEANEKGYDLDSVAFVSTQGDPIELGFTEEADSKKVLIMETKSGEELLINLEGKVLYINQSAHSGQEVSFAGKKSVLVRDQAENANESALSYIIYE